MYDKNMRDILHAAEHARAEVVECLVNERTERVSSRTLRERETIGFIRTALRDYSHNKLLFYDVVRTLLSDKKLRKEMNDGTNRSGS